MDKTCFSLFHGKKMHFWVLSTLILRLFRLFHSFSVKFESWSRILAFFARFWPLKSDNQPQLSYFSRYVQINGTVEFPVTKYASLDCWEWFLVQEDPFLGQKWRFRPLFGLCHIDSKYTFGHYVFYIRGRNDFKPPRVVYFLMGSTMVGFALLYLEKWWCYGRFSLEIWPKKR